MEQTFKVIAKRSGDSVEYELDADTTEMAYQRAKVKANSIFGYKPGEAGAPTVTVKPLGESKEE